MAIEPFVARVKIWGNSKAFIIPHNVASLQDVKLDKKYKITMEEIK